MRFVLRRRKTSRRSSACRLVRLFTILKVCIKSRLLYLFCKIQRMKCRICWTKHLHRWPVPVVVDRKWIPAIHLLFFRLYRPQTINHANAEDPSIHCITRQTHIISRSLGYTVKLSLLFTQLVTTWHYLEGWKLHMKIMTKRFVDIHCPTQPKRSSVYFRCVLDVIFFCFPDINSKMNHRHASFLAKSVTNRRIGRSSTTELVRSSNLESHLPSRTVNQRFLKNCITQSLAYPVKCLYAPCT